MRTDIIQLLDSAFPLWNSAFQERQVGTGALNTPSAGRRESGQDFVTVSANTMVKHLLTILRDHFGLTRIVVSNRDKFDSSTMTIVQVEPTDDPYFDQCVAREVKWGYRTASGATFRPAEVHVFRLRSGK
ncbi:MAG: nucleotide exchange factor GrpE [Ktedonobacterales bacterium]